MHLHSHTLLRLHSLPSFPKPFPSSSLLLPPFNRRHAVARTSSNHSPRCNLPPCFDTLKLRGTREFTRAFNKCAAPDSCNGLDESVSDSSDWECQLYPSIVSSDSYDGSSRELLKFMVLFGFLTLGESYPAAAASDFATALNAFPIFGDIGDISTGVSANLFL